jgi:hypothetical protein
MSAGVHRALGFRAERLARALVERQRVHVGTQPGDAPWPSAAHEPNDARAGNAAMLDAERVQLAFDQRRRAFFLKAQFRMAVDVAPDRDDALDDVGRDRLRYALSSCSAETPAPRYRPC